MKKTQKILLAVLAIVFITVVVIVIAVKTKENNNDADTTQPVFSTSSEENISDDTIGNFQEQNNPDSNNTTDSSVTENSGHKTDINNNSSNSSNKPSYNRPAYDFTGAEILQSQKSTFGDIRLLSAKSNGLNVYLIEATVESKKHYYEIPGSYIVENMYYANVDGRYGDEVIIHSNTGVKGVYDNQVLKISKDGIQPLLSKKQAVLLMSGFTSTLKADFNVEISNQYTKKKETINVLGINNENYSDSYWDENGNVVESDPVDNVWFEENYHSFEPRDVDSDGFYEIVCMQKASLGSPDSVIGNAQTILKFDKEAKQFLIADSEFYPKTK